jgi:hypothetical protein
MMPAHRPDIVPIERSEHLRILISHTTGRFVARTAYQARCSCGWTQLEARDAWSAADRDGREHLVAVAADAGQQLSLFE